MGTVLLHAAAAVADEAPPLTLRWSVPDPDGCPDRAAMGRDVGLMLGPDDGMRKAVVADGTVVRRPNGDYGVSLVVVTDETREARSFKAASCREASRASALIIALAIDSRAKAPEPGARPASSPPAAPSIAQVTAAPAAAPPPPSLLAASASSTGAGKAAAPSRATGAGGSLGVALSGRLAGGMQPGPSLGVEATLFGSWGPWRLEALLAFSPATRAELPESPTKGGALSSLGAGARSCLGFRLSRVVRLGPCVGAGFVRATGTAFGTDRATTGSATWGTLSGEALASVALGPRFSFRGTLGPTFSLDRPTFVIETSTGKIPVFRPDFLGLTAHFGAELRFL